MDLFIYDIIATCQIVFVPLHLSVDTRDTTLLRKAVWNVKEWLIFITGASSERWQTILDLAAMVNLVCQLSN